MSDESNAQPEPKARLFFGIWPPPEAAGELRRYAESLHAETRGRLIPTENLHLTLAFLGGIAPDRVRPAAAAAERVMGRRFELSIDRIGYWPGSRILWAGPAALPAALANLASALDESLRQSGFALDDRAYAAHVTLARKAGRPRTSSPLPRLRWAVTEFILAESRNSDRGVRYMPLERFALPPDRESPRAASRRRR